MGECSDDPNGPGRPPLPRKGAIRPRHNNKTSPQDDRSEVTRPRRQSTPMESTLSEKDTDDNPAVRSPPFTANDSHASVRSPEQQRLPPVKLGTSRSRGHSPRRASEPPKTIKWTRTNRVESSSSLKDDSSTHSQSSASSIREKMQSFKRNADVPPAFQAVRRSSMGDSSHTDLSGASSTQGNGLPPSQYKGQVATSTAKRPPRQSNGPPKEKASSFPSLPPPPPPKSNFFVSPVTGTKHIRNQDHEEDSSQHSNSVAMDMENSQASLIQTPPPQNSKSHVKSTSPRKRSYAAPNNGKDATTAPQEVKMQLPLPVQSPSIDHSLSEHGEGSQRSSTTPIVATLTSPTSNRFSKSNWKTMANPKLLPPAFQELVASMRGTPVTEETSPSTNLKPPPPLEGRQQEDIRSLLRGGQSIAELRRVFSQRNLFSTSDTAANESTEENIETEQEPPAKNPHGVVMYERPDGFGEAATPANQMAYRSVEEDLDALEDPNDPACYEALLASIAACKLDDGANRAGKVLKRMKHMQMPVSDITIILLRLCTEIPDRVPEPKPQEVALRSILIEETHYTDGPNGEKTPLPTATKRVRFADTNELRIIRRRRSIGSNERWDDPLTPPKRISAYVDVSVSRFSTGLRDDRPALPRRTNSMSSLLSGSSHSSDGSFSSSSTEQDPLFKLPFGNSPEIASRKKNSDSLKTPVQKLRKGLSKPATRLAGKRPTPPAPDVPAAPTRKASLDMDLSPMAPTDEPPAPGPPGEPMSPSIPPPPLADFPLETPPPPPRRRVERRRSISGIERRADTPLTPPRRVSDKSALYAAQTSLREARAPADPGVQLPSGRLRRPSVGSPIESFQRNENRPKEPRSSSQPEEAAPSLPQRKRSIMTTHDSSENSELSDRNESIPPPPPPPTDALEVSMANTRISELTTQRSAQRTVQPQPPPPPPMEEPATRINKVERHKEVIADEWSIFNFGEGDADNDEQPQPEGDAP